MGVVKTKALIRCAVTAVDFHCFTSIAQILFSHNAAHNIYITKPLISTTDPGLIIYIFHNQVFVLLSFLLRSGLYTTLAIEWDVKHEINRMNGERT